MKSGLFYDIGPKLGKDAIGIEINKELFDTSKPKKTLRL